MTTRKRRLRDRGCRPDQREHGGSKEREPGRCANGSVGGHDGLLGKRVTGFKHGRERQNSRSLDRQQHGQAMSFGPRFVPSWIGLAAIAAFASAAIAQVLTQGSPPQPSLAEASNLIVAATNAFRREQKLGPLQQNADLAEAAGAFASFMARTNQYGHAADGSTPAARADQFGYAHCIISENIAYQFNSDGFSTEALGKQFFQVWQRSAGHRRNMLDADVTHTAVAIARSADTGYFYAVQMFGRPKWASIAFSLENRTTDVVEYGLDEQTFLLRAGVTRTHERCRPSKLGVPGTTVEPRNGQRFVIQAQDGALRLIPQ